MEEITNEKEKNDLIRQIYKFQKYLNTFTNTKYLIYLIVKKLYILFF